VQAALLSMVNANRSAALVSTALVGLGATPGSRGLSDPWVVSRTSRYLPSASLTCRKFHKFHCKTGSARGL
jgi:hypothetical protein